LAGQALSVLRSKSDYSADWVDLSPGARRFVHCWHSSQVDPKAAICIVHGLGEHGGRYGKLADGWVSQGYHVWAFDQQGHGKTTGKRGVVQDYDSLLDEIGMLMRHAKLKLPEKPCFLFGHSMGGNLVANYTLRRPEKPSAIVLSSPFFQTQREPRGLLNWIARSGLALFPDLCVGTGIRTEWLTDNPEEQKLVNADPLYHRRVSLRLGAALIDNGRWAIQNASQLTVPTLIIHGLDDRLTLPSGSQAFAQQCQQSSRSQQYCRLELLANHQHETFRDLNGQSAIDLIDEFWESVVTAETCSNDH
jgi:acylglycerol lipase